MRFERRFAGTALFIGLGACGGPAPEIHGRVVDHAGNPLSGVQVRVAKTTMSATTSGNGRYVVDFPPGEFAVEFTAEGFTSHHLELNVQQAVEFPAEDVTLYPVPTGSGVFLLGAEGPLEIPAVAVEKQTISKSYLGSTYKLLCPEEGSVTVGAGRLEFIDAAPETLMLAKLGGYGLIFTSDHKTNKKTGYNGLFKDSKKIVGSEEVVVRTAELEPGRYAWIELKRKSSGDLDIDKKGECRPFVVQ